jgi:EAL domain-containing protein (putative c-di-GMP-specific phosphodiesterase class I)
MSGLAHETAEAIGAALAAAPAARLAGAGFVIGGCDGLRGADAAAALARADRALAEAELGQEPVVLAEGAFEALEAKAQQAMPAADSAGSSAVPGARALREQLAQALAHGRVRLGHYPLLAPDGALVHLECPLRVQLDPEGEYLRARRWLASAARGSLMPQADLAALDLALTAIARDALPRCVHVSMRSFGLPAFAAAVTARLEATRSAITSRLWIEWTEVDAVAYAAEAEALRHALPSWQRLGVKLGIEHAGGSPHTLAASRALGLDYVKVDARHIAGVADDDAVREYARSLVTLIHGLGFQAYAEGADCIEDLHALWPLGFDGATGAAVRQVRQRDREEAQQGEGPLTV